MPSMNEEERIKVKMAGTDLTLGMLWEPMAEQTGIEERKKWLSTF